MVLLLVTGVAAAPNAPLLMDPPLIRCTWSVIIIHIIITYKRPIGLHNIVIIIIMYDKTAHLESSNRWWSWLREHIIIIMENILPIRFQWWHYQYNWPVNVFLLPPPPPPGRRRRWCGVQQKFSVQCSRYSVSLVPVTNFHYQILYYMRTSL